MKGTRSARLLRLVGAAFALQAGAATVCPKDTGEALVNPGMGLVHYHYSNRLWAYGMYAKPGETDPLPGTSVVYFRVLWNDVEPQEGVFRWDIFDAVAQNWIKAGKQIAFRIICCNQTENATPDWVRAALARPFSDDPGTKFLYSNTGPYLAGMLIQRRAGCDLVHYLMPRLFEPLGIRLPTWEVDPNGLTFGAGGLFLNIDELHLFGQLLLQKGFWKGKQVLPENWVAQSTAKQVENGREGYGYLFWRGKHNSFRADGKYGQYTIVFPDKQAVVTVTAESRKEPAVLETVYDCLVPQF